MKAEHSTIAVLISLSLFAIPAAVLGESMRREYLSPNGAYNIFVEGHNRSPNLFYVRVLHGEKELWRHSYDHSSIYQVQVWWSADSKCCLMQYPTEKKECRLSILQIAKGGVLDFPVVNDKLKGLTSIVEGSVKWQQDGSVQLEGITKNGKTKMRIVWSCRLEPVEK
jgi:hypothetical protein